MNKTTKKSEVISLRSTFAYYRVDFLKQVAQELMKKEFLARTGLDMFSKAELFAYAVLLDNGFFEEEEEEEEVNND